MSSNLKSGLMLVAALSIIAIAVIMVVGFYGTIAYVAAHFIHKFW